MTTLRRHATTETSSRQFWYLLACLPQMLERRECFYKAGTMKEEWKEFANGNYEVSNHGMVRRKTPGHSTWPGRPAKRVLMGMGYYVVNPTIDGKNVLMYVHRIVAEAFIGGPFEGRELNHIDGDKLNNRVDNLEYVTHRRNMAHARELGLINDRCTYPQSTIDRIRELASSGMRSPAIERETGVNARYCRSIINNEIRKA